MTRLLPYIYEADQLVEWEEKFFWGARRKRTRQASIASEVLFDEAHDEETKPRSKEKDYEDVKPLAEELIDTLVDLLFFSDFTLPRPQSNSKVSYAIWQSGVGCNTSVGTSKEFESNRCEILRLLLTLTSQSMYMSPNLLPVQGVRAITYIATNPDKQVVLSVLCSLLNTVSFSLYSHMYVKVYQTNTVRLSNTILQVGEFRTTTWFSKTLSKSLSPMHFSFYWS